MSKDLFLEHRIQELDRFDTWTKRETLNKGKQLAIDIVNQGDITAEEALAKLTRFSDLISNAINELKPNIVIDKEININGVKLTYVSGGKILKYEDDPEWNQINSTIERLKVDLKFREDQLKKSSNTEDDVIFDGEVIPKVPVKTYRKSYIKVQY